MSIADPVRQRSLELALNHANASKDYSQPTADDVVKSAATFEEYLRTGRKDAS